MFTSRSLFKINLEFLTNIRGLSRSDLAKKMKVSTARVGQLFSENANPTLDTIFTLAKILDVPPSFLIEADLEEDVLFDDVLSEENDLNVLSEIRQALFKYQSAVWYSLHLAEEKAKKRAKKVIKKK